MKDLREFDANFDPVKALAKSYVEHMETCARELLDEEGLGVAMADLTDTREIGKVLQSQGYDIIFVGLKDNAFSQLVVLINVHKGFVGAKRVTMNIFNKEIKRETVSESEVKMAGVNINKELKALREHVAS